MKHRVDRRRRSRFVGGVAPLQRRRAGEPARCTLVRLVPMDNLFSHAAAASQPEPADALEPLVYTVIVPGAVARAFVGFTEHTHLWWPLEEHGV